LGRTHVKRERLSGDPKRLASRGATSMALHVLAYNLTRVMNIVGVQPLMAAMRA
jgi:hypothetical protein